LDAPERLALWPDMARLSAALGHGDEAGLCWMNALWADVASGAVPAWSWFRAEASRVSPPEVRGRSWGAAVAASAQPREIDGADLDRVLAVEGPTSADMRALAAYVFWAAVRQPAPAALVQRLARVRHFLDGKEQRLPVRAVWLAAVGLARLAGGDVLGLAR